MRTVTLKPTTDILDHAQDLHEAAMTVVSDLRAEVANHLSTFKDQTGSQLSDAKDLANEHVDTVKTFIKEHPVAALGIGLFAASFVAAWAFKR